MEKQPWWPRIETYPVLILDDHATEWASRIADDQDRIEVDGEGMGPMRVPANPSSETFDSTVDTNATQALGRSYAQAPQYYEPERVWSGELSSGLC